ncbi:hypothetical protein ElyMa_004160400 [Elysia marginata]|uniref:Uncharacterized protein n=1 Tax=Elysia marginata TaxID=1093978 RepID=A0AAV4GHB0_9GAST|nr:hypothetical protein ElyMa_004160400 [Elysia marginata]
MDVTSTDDEWACQSHQTPKKPGNHDTFIAAEEEFMVDEEIVAELSPNLASFLTKRFGTLTAEKKLKSKLELYKRPANCKVLTAPLTNKEIWRTLKTLVQKDRCQIDECPEKHGKSHDRNG